MGMVRRSALRRRPLPPLSMEAEAAVWAVVVVGLVEVVGVVLQLVVVMVVLLLLVLEAGEEEASGWSGGLRSSGGDGVGKEGG